MTNIFYVLLSQKTQISLEIEMTREKYDSHSGAGGSKVGPSGLAGDYITAWMHLGHIEHCLELFLDGCWTDPFLEDQLHPVLRYEQYVQERITEYAPFILKDSDPRAIQRINSLAAQFSAELPLIREQRDKERVLWFFSAAREIIIKPH